MLYISILRRLSRNAYSEFRKCVFRGITVTPTDKRDFACNDDSGMALIGPMSINNASLIRFTIFVGLARLFDCRTVYLAFIRRLAYTKFSEGRPEMKPD